MSRDADPSALQFWTLYLSRFAGGFGSITLVILIPKLAPELGLGGVGLGLLYTAFTLAQTLMVVPLAWAGDRYDKRLVLLGTLALGVLTYAAFGFVTTGRQLMAVRAFQGVVFTGMGLMTLALVGELATKGTRANHIGKANAASFAASIVGGLSAGFLYDYFAGGREVFLLITALYVVTFGATALLLSSDDTRIHGFPFSDLAVNRRILTLTSFRAQYSVAVTLVRNWVPVFAGYALAQGGLGYPAFAVSVITVSEKFTNMLLQPFTGRLSDRSGRSLFVFAGGGTYGVVALLVPFTPMIGATVGLPESYPIVGAVSAAFLPLVALNCGLGIADSFREPASMALFADEGSDGEGVASSFGIRELVWRPGSVLAPVAGGWLMAEIGMDSVFYVGGAFAVLGALTFLGILWRAHGAGALREW
ncbi:MFS transporter [Halorarum halobium]|uniref:MFS transporter n=1 Tax=Halorarum halobium TaxID=3075121 RepID=UPI0028AD665B|nr:MFS transporter [Halobaculum sp. XH14]